MHFDAPAGMLIPDSVATTVSTAFRQSGASFCSGAHPSARRSAAVLDAAVKRPIRSVAGRRGCGGPMRAVAGRSVVLTHRRWNTK